MDKKRILIVCGPITDGGAEKVLLDVLKNFDYDIYEIDLALIHKEGVRLKDVPAQVNIIELWTKGSLNQFIGIKFSTKLHSNILLARRMNSGRLRKDYTAEISFLEGWSTKLLSLRKTKARKIAWIHTDFSRHHTSNGCYHNDKEEHETYGKMDVIVNVSEGAREGFCSLMPELEEKATVIYNPVDKKEIMRKATTGPNPYKESPLKEFIAGNYGLPETDPKIIVAVGRLNHEKNPGRFIETAALAKSEGLDVRFVWVGDGVLRQEMEDKIQEMGLGDMVRLVGFKDNPYPYLYHADIMTLPSNAEGFSIVTCETMCLGIPVVSTATAGQQELLGDNERGIIVDFTPQALLEGIKRLVEDPALAPTLSQNAAKRVEAFTPERMLERTYSIL